MRKELKPFLDKKVKVVGTLDKYGLKSKYRGGDTITLLLKDIRIELEGKTIETEHAWLSAGKWFEKANLTVGSQVEMNCHVKEYIKGYVDHRNFVDERHVDIGINRASQIKCNNVGGGQSFEEFYNSMIKSGKFISNKYSIAKEKAVQ